LQALLPGARWRSPAVRLSDGNRQQVLHRAAERFGGCKPREGAIETQIEEPPSGMSRSYFHLHLVSDSTGETLLNVSRAATAQYQGISAIEHIYPLVRNRTQLDRVIT
jgi:hypothetical protein